MHIIPSSTSSHNDFDFYLGKWNIHNRKLKSRLKRCTEWIEFEATDEDINALRGLANLNFYKCTIDGKPFEGMTVRLFNPVTKLWSIYWADSNVGILDTPVVGSFDNKIGRFFATDQFEGKPIRVQFQWDATNPANPIWSQAFSDDEGKTWEWNWYMHASKMKT